MSTKTTPPQDDAEKQPTKEEVIAFLQEQIEVKSLQRDLQKINMELAMFKAEEMKAYQMAANFMTKQPELQDYVLTQEDLDENPDLVKEDYKVGDTIQVPKQVERKLKKA